ncbi:unnamed protein product, partial [Schistosoma mattheei]
HANSWGKGYPEILTKCYIKGEPDGTLGPINPINNISYNFMSQLYKELFSVFPDNWFHLGGDEVEYNCWHSNPSIIEFMKRMKFGDDYHRLEGYYINNLIQIINDVKPPGRNITPVVWQEIFENGFRGDKSTVIHVWKDLYWESVVKNATKTGYRVLFSAAWYLNYISYGDDWRYHYHVDPRDFGGSKDDAKLVIGGEAAMWGEYVDDTNLFSRSWPRGSAVAERLWTHGSPNATDFIPRVEELRCRMLSCKSAALALPIRTFTSASDPPCSSKHFIFFESPSSAIRLLLLPLCILRPTAAEAAATLVVFSCSCCCDCDRMARSSAKSRSSSWILDVHCIPCFYPDVDVFSIQSITRRRMWSILAVTATSAFSASDGMLSSPATLPLLICLTAIMISSIVGRPTSIRRSVCATSMLDGFHAAG